MHSQLFCPVDDPLPYTSIRLSVRPMLERLGSWRSPSVVVGNQSNRASAWDSAARSACTRPAHFRGGCLSRTCGPGLIRLHKTRSGRPCGQGRLRAAEPSCSRSIPNCETRNVGDRRRDAIYDCIDDGIRRKAVLACVRGCAVSA